MPFSCFCSAAVTVPHSEHVILAIPNVDNFLAELTLCLFDLQSVFLTSAIMTLLEFTLMAIKFILRNEVTHEYVKMEIIKQQHKLRANCQQSCVIGWCCFTCFDFGLCFRALHLNLTEPDVTLN